MDELIEILEDIKPDVDYENCENLIDGHYQAEIRINLNSNITKIIKIPEAEIKNRTAGQSSIELWSYFLLTRTRSLIEFLFINRVKKFPPEF